MDSLSDKLFALSVVLVAPPASLYIVWKGSRAILYGRIKQKGEVLFGMKARLCGLLCRGAG